MTPLCYLNEAKSNALEVLRAFARGSGASITTRLVYDPSRVAVFYGVDRLTYPLWNDVQLARGKYFYIDNGYFLGRAKGGPYLRISYCRPQHDGVGDSNGQRWKALGLTFAPWRANGDHILIATQSDWWHERHGERVEDWVKGVRMQLMQHTQRKVIVRHKPNKKHKEPALEKHLRGAHAVIVHTSMVGTDALLAGVPIFTTLLDSCFLRMGRILLSEIERPFMPDDRELWARVLADNQWTLEEIASGVAWRTLHRAY